MLEVSATFDDLPSSKILAGDLVDQYVTNFEKIPNVEEVFEKKTIVFCDDNSQLDLKSLKDNKVKYLILNDAIKDYAKEIVRVTEAPCLIIAGHDYSVGFSFGDVNVISTGVSKRTIITEIKGTPENPG